MLKENFVKKGNKFVMALAVCAFVLFACLLISGCAPSGYKPTLKNPEIKTPDILQDGTLKIGVDFENPPLAGETSKSAGIDIDVASAICDQLGLKAEFIDVGSSAQLSLNNKKVDIVMGLSKSVNSDEIWKSDVYLQTAAALFSTEEKAAIPQKGGSDKISTQLASASALIAQNQYGSGAIKLESSLSASFEALKKGDVKYVAADAVVGTYTGLNSDINASIIALLSKPSGYCIGVSKSNKALQEKIANIVADLSKNGTFDSISCKWLGKTLDFSNTKMTPEASNQADAGELEGGVYGQTSGTSNRS